MTIARIASQQTGTLANNATSITLAYPVNVTNGNLLVIGSSKYTNDVDDYVVGDISKSAGTATVGTFLLDAEEALIYDGSSRISSAVYSVPATGTGSCTITIGGALSGSYLLIALEEVSGADVSATRLDGAISASAGTGAPDTGNVASTAGALFFGALGTGTNSATTHTIDAAYTQIYESEDGANNMTGSFGDRIVTGSTTDAASWTAPTTIDWVASLAVYKESAVAEAAAFPPVPASRILKTSYSTLIRM